LSEAGQWTADGWQRKAKLAKNSEQAAAKTSNIANKVEGCSEP
jgi:hypothetical protein